ncbi:MAG TPA: TlpA disulfide reductase family protein [Steroidobacteraceae bacterium]|nr:TlpA disulfide reductase family protein [Steroidobacteraceae bacterium]
MLTRWTKIGLLAVTTLILATSASAGGEQAAPTFSLPARGGATIDLSQFRGQVVMINFWASWCGPCRQEMPLLESMYEKYKPLGFTLLGVNVEPDQKDAMGFLQQTPVTFPVLFDAKSKVSGLYNVQGMPTTVFIDRKGNVRLVHQSYKPGDENLYLDQIRTLIRE